MAEATTDTEAADDDSDEEYEQRAWATATPTTRIKGTVTEVFTPQQITGDDEQTDSSYGVVIEDPDVVIGELYRNNHKPDDDLTRSAVDEDSSQPTDYRIADAADDAVTVVGDTLATDEQSTVDGETANQYDQADDFDEDEILLWVSGMSGDRIIRHLDINGRPYAKYSEGNYIAGLLQAHDDWFADGADRSSLVQEGKAPRLARPPELRPDVDEVLLDISRGNGRAYHGHVFRADDFEAEFGSVDHPTDEIPRGQYGLDADSELDLRMMDYDEMDAFFEGRDYNVHQMFFDDGGNGWGDQPDDVDTSSSSSGFDVSVTEADDGGTSDAEQDAEFVDNIVETMQSEEAAHGRAPDEIWQAGLETMVDRNMDEWSEPPTGERLADIRQSVYERVAWLDVDELE